MGGYYCFNHIIVKIVINHHCFMFFPLILWDTKPIWHHPLKFGFPGILDGLPIDAMRQNLDGFMAWNTQHVW
jgi:hypothetical protein